MTGDMRGAVIVWRAATGAALLSLDDAHTAAVTVVRFVHQKPLRRRRKKKNRQSDEGDADLVGGVLGLSRKDTTAAFVVSGSRDSSIRTWGLKRRAQIASTNLPAAITSGDLTPDGQRCVVGDANGGIHMFKLEGFETFDNES